MRRAELIQQLAARLTGLSLPHPIRAAVDGFDAAGKTTLAEELAEALRASGCPVVRASIDRFHNPRAVRYRQGPDSPAGYYEDSFDLAALRRDLLDPLGPGGSRQIKTALYDFRADAPVPAPQVQAAPNTILVFDGVFLQRPELADAWDYTIFVQVEVETILARAVQRDRDLFGDAQAVIERYQARYLPAQQRYLAEHRPNGKADVVVGNDDVENPVIVRG